MASPLDHSAGAKRKRTNPFTTHQTKGMTIMKQNPTLRRRLSAFGALTVLAAALMALACSKEIPSPQGGPMGKAVPAGDGKTAVRLDVPTGQWPMFGGSPSRNMVDPNDRDLPTEWSVEKGQEKNIK